MNTQTRGRTLAPVLRHLIAAAATGAAMACAAQPAAPAAAPPLAFAIEGFDVRGDNPLGAARTQEVLAPFVRADATLDTLQQAASALEQALRERGYGLYRVVLQPQTVGRRVALEILTFPIGVVRVEGNAHHDADNVRQGLPELREGAVPNLRRLAVQTAISNENPGKQVQVALRPSAEPDKVDATVKVSDVRPWDFAMSLSNYGSDATGQDRFTVAGGHSNLFNRDHQFTAAYTTSLERPQDVRQLGLAYRVPLPALGGVVGASYMRSDVVGNFGAFSSTGAGHVSTLNYTHYLEPEGGKRTYVTLGLEDKIYEAARIDGTPVPGQGDRRSRPLVAGYVRNVEGDGQVWRVGVELAVNTGSGAGNDLPTYQSEDARITTHRWKALRTSASGLVALADWQMALRAQGQYSRDALISGEQFGLGGPGSVRGTRQERPIAGDKGLLASVELRTPELAAGWRLLGFVDAGWLGNNVTGASRPSSDIIASVGVGLRFGQGPLSVTLDYGRLVKGSRTPVSANSAAPQKGDDRVYLNLTIRF